MQATLPNGFQPAMPARGSTRSGLRALSETRFPDEIPKNDQISKNGEIPAGVATAGVAVAGALAAVGMQTSSGCSGGPYSLIS